jgi:hypothetical protein
LPTRTTNIPAGGGAGQSIDLGGLSGNYGVDSSGPLSALGGLNRFTIVGWINNRSSASVSGGNVVVTWAGDVTAQGVTLVFRDGSLDLGINRPPDGTARSSLGRIPADFAVGPSNWRFFAVTYDASLEQVAFYFGAPDADATLDVVRTYSGVGAVGTSTGVLTVGNPNPPPRASFPNRIFKGLINDARIYDTVLDLPQIVRVQHGEDLNGIGGDLAPRITQIKFLEDGQMYLQIAGRVGQTYRILAGDTPSADVVVSTNVVGTTGTLEFFEPRDPQRTVRFYRVVTP